jgi:long-chain acyl-CoA synthetase
MESDNVIRYFEEAIRNNLDLPSLSDYGGKQYLFRDVGEKILHLHSVYRACGIKKGDKIALWGRNSADWGIVFISVITYGAVIVPILPDFKPADIHHIVTHSDSVILFADESLFKTLDPSALRGVKFMVTVSGLKVLYSEDPSLADITSENPDETANVSVETGHIHFPETSPDDIMIINYTSGTTGFSKGVVLQHKSILANIRYARHHMPLEAGDNILSILPVAHMFGCAFEFLFPFTLGCSITFLNKLPSPAILVQSMGEVRPALILTVPVLIEKVYKSRIQPELHKPVIHFLTRVPGIRNIIFGKIRKKLEGLFGGNFRVLVIGGAAFNPQVEAFMHRIGLRFTVGYGMTECGPLISYASWDTTCPGASGRIVDELEIRIDSDDPQNHPGEIRVRGNHVMLGYYKNEEATRAVIDNERWLHTGDLGIIDEKGNIHIRGRSKSMILGPTGQNIYPEELESRLNNRFMVMESLILDRNHKLVALIYPDAEAMEKAGIARENLPEILKKYIDDLNREVPKYMQVIDFEIRETEFEKTPKRSIKRFLYQ